MRPLIAIGSLLAALVLALPAFAQATGYQISWWTVDNGALQNGTGGAFALRATIGQPDAQPAGTGGGYLVTGGFWYPVAASSPPGGGGGGNQGFRIAWLPVVVHQGPQ